MDSKVVKLPKAREVINFLRKGTLLGWVNTLGFFHKPLRYAPVIHLSNKSPVFVSRSDVWISESNATDIELTL